MSASVSVIIPCFNQARFLADAINSALVSTGVTLEIIVIDDGSTDETSAVAQSFFGKIVYLHQENAGLSAARNSGLRLATGKYCHFLDSDDWVIPGFYSDLVETLESRPEIGLAYSSVRVVNEVGQTTRENIAKTVDDPAFVTLLRHNVFAVHAAIVRRDLLEGVGEFDTKLTSAEDWDFWLRLAKRGCKFQPVPHAWVCYRKHSQSMSHVYYRQRRNLLDVLAKHQVDAEQSPEGQVAIRWGRYIARYTAFEYSLLPCVVGQIRRGKVWQATKDFASAVVDDPTVLRFCLADYWMAQVYKWLRERRARKAATQVDRGG